MVIVLYIDNSDKSKSLKHEIDRCGKKIWYTITDNIDVIKALHIPVLPCLQVGKQFMDYENALKWLDESGVRPS